MTSSKVSPKLLVIKHTSVKNLHSFRQLEEKLKDVIFELLSGIQFRAALGGGFRRQDTYSPSKMSIYIMEINVDIYHEHNIDVYWNICRQLQAERGNGCSKL